MKEMTTAEFGKAKLDSLTEPVKIRRYTKAVGTYYPEGYIAALPPADPLLMGTEYGPMAPDLDAELAAARKVIAGLEDDNRHLKKLLAAREATPVQVSRPEHPMKDVFADLAKQDREFFERKLGKPGKTK